MTKFSIGEKAQVVSEDQWNKLVEGTYCKEHSYYMPRVMKEYCRSIGTMEYVDEGLRCTSIMFEEIPDWSFCSCVLQKPISILKEIYD